MIKNVCKVLQSSVILMNILTWGGVNVVYSASQGVYRGNFAVIEVDEDSPMTAIPDTGTWYNGPLDTSPQQYDVLVAARGNIDTKRSEVNLTVTPAETPDFFANDNGKIVAAEPQIFGTVTMPMGPASFIQISLIKINNNAVGNMSTIDKHVCLGFRKQGETDFLDILHAGKMEGGYEVLKGGEVMELVPLLSKTDTTTAYTPVKPGDPVEFDFALDAKFDFGSVFRVSVVADSREWIIGLPCDMGELEKGDSWYNLGSLGIGKIPGYDGDRLLAISRKGELAHSENGIHWIRDMGIVGDPDGVWYAGPKYGNGVWCVVSGADGHGMRRLGADGVWSALSDGDPYSKEYSLSLEFGDGKFMIFGGNNNGALISRDAVNWGKGISINMPYDPIVSLAYGNGKWFGISVGASKLFFLEDGKEAWEVISWEDAKLDGEVFPGGTMEAMFGLCYAEGYFYMIYNRGNYAIKSPDGKNWSTVCSDFIGSSRKLNNGPNITYFKGKLYTFAKDGKSYSIGIPQP